MADQISYFFHTHKDAPMASLTIKLSDKDLNLLTRIAEHDDRRLNDFVQLIFSCGLECYYCDEIVCVSKLPDEYTQEELDQRVLNVQLMEQYSLHEERVEHGYKYVDHLISTHHQDKNSGEYKDLLIKPIAARIKKYALK